MVPLLPESFWEFHDSFIPSETAGPLAISTNVTNETFPVKRSPRPRTIRDLTITSERGSLQRDSIALVDVRVRKEPLWVSKNLKLRKKMMESDVMNDKGSLHQKTNEVCIMEDAESIVLGWFENTKLSRVNNGSRCLLQVDWESLGTSPSRIQKAFGETAAEVMDARVEGEGEIHPPRRPRVAERVAFHVPPEVDPQNLDFDVNEFRRSCPNPVVGSVSGNCEIIQKADVRRGYPVMKSRFLNFGNDIHTTACDSPGTLKSMSCSSTFYGSLRSCLIFFNFCRCQHATFCGF